MILKVKDENGQFKEVVLKGLKGEKGDRGEDGTILQQKEIDDIKSSLENNMKKIYKTCSEIGMTLNDENNNNHILMSEFINLGYSLKVDNFYNVNINNSIEINNNIEFISESNKYGFNFISNVNNTCWKIINGCSKITAENLTIKGSKVILFSHGNMCHFMDLFKFNNNKVSGDFVLLNLRCETELTDNCKINKIVINNNHLEIKYIDIFDDEEYYVRGFVKVTNVPFDSVDIHYNTLINMERTFGYFSVDDANTYRDEHGTVDYITDARKFINVTNNYVKNDDNCVCPFEYASLRYCCFIFAECFELVYKNNYVDGLKSDKIKGKVEDNLETLELYDVYVSADYYVYHNNVNKNIITYGGTALYDRNFLIKCKYGKNISVKNNRFIREHSLIERLNITDDKYMEVKLVDNASARNKENWIISNNIIDCYSITAETEKINSVYYELSNNTVNAKYIYGFLLRVIGVDLKTIKITGNKFYASDEVIDKPFILLYGVYQSGITYEDIKNTNIFIENNIFDIKNFYKDFTLGNTADTNTRYIFHENMIIRNNIFYDRPKFMYINSNLIYKDNTYLVNNNFTRFLPETVYNKTEITETLNISNKEGTLTLLSLGINGIDRYDYRQNASRLINVNLKYIMNDGSIKNVDFSLIYDDKNKKIKCLNNGTTYDISVNLSTTNIIVDGITFAIRRSDTSGSLTTIIPTGALMLETNVKVNPSILLS